MDEELRELEEYDVIEGHSTPLSDAMTDEEHTLTRKPFEDQVEIVKVIEEFLLSIPQEAKTHLFSCNKLHHTLTLTHHLRWVLEMDTLSPHTHHVKNISTYNLWHANPPCASCCHRTLILSPYFFLEPNAHFLSMTQIVNTSANHVASNTSAFATLGMVIYDTPQTQPNDGEIML